ncbi:mitochondrial sodium/calcium exchanger protein-like [Topomyia yanbarensis]|uniref:mitochondrial sodium/calcium exchanger protein-like n=1 Tax=Topomyia yanbarensis TaxID=2498891 RepID=UPI00273CDFF7|nr:mitochondrial sodium/calcium exchanger protein-like [Topomyia yanbarensis]
MSTIYANLSSPEVIKRILRHTSYVSGDIPDDCNQIHNLAPVDKCDFVKRTASCSEDVYYFDYTYFLFCTIGNENTGLFRLGAVLLVLGLLICFTVLGTTADQFFCPVLAVISKTLRVSETVAGVTILAFGNGSPDLFTAISNPLSDTEMMFGELLGAATFVIGVVAALILVIRPFQTDPAGVVRDVLFFLFAVCWITICAYDEKFHLSDAIVVVIVYVAYLTIVLIDFFLRKRKLHAVESRISLSGELPAADSYYNQLRGETEIIIRPRNPSLGSEVDISRNRVSVFVSERPSKNYHLIKDFYEHLNPIDIDEWEVAGWCGRTFTILKIPIRLVLTLIIPVVDYTVERHGWCKLLNMIHCFTLPLIFLSISGWITEKMFDIPVFAWLLIFSSIVVTTIFFTSRTDRPPRYHLVYAPLAFAGSIMIIYVIAQEVVSLLVTLGLVLNLSKSMLGLSVLAWGNSIGDMFSNITLAKQGYGKMAFAACMGGPLFNLCLGLGITIIVKALKRADHVAFSREGAMGLNIEAFLVQLLGTILLALLFTGFQGRRSVGFMMISTYIVFFLFCLLGEFEIIHPYGTDHNNEGEFV